MLCIFVKNEKRGIVVSVFRLVQCAIGVDAGGSRFDRRALCVRLSVVVARQLLERVAKRE